MNVRSMPPASGLPPTIFSHTRYPLPLSRTAHCTRNLGFLLTKEIHSTNTTPPQIRVSYNFLGSLSPELSYHHDSEEDADVLAANEFQLESSQASTKVEDCVNGIKGSVSAFDTVPQLGELKCRRVEKFCKEVQVFGEGIIDADELASIYSFPIDKFQRLAIQAFLRGSSVVVSAPTSSGKTLIAETAAVATVARRRRIFYTTPLKALSNQKFQEFRETFGDNNVGLLTGDSAVNKDAQIVIMTTEILRNMLYQSIGTASSGGLFNVDVIILDEVHYLSDISRGTVWEEIIIYCPKEVQVICLSATVANPHELAGWLCKIHGKTEVVSSSKRPVALSWHFVTKTAMFPLLDAKGTRMNKMVSHKNLQFQESGVKSKDRDFELAFSSFRSLSRQSHFSNNKMNNTHCHSQAPRIIDVLWHLKGLDMLPAIWFIFSRKGCDSAVQNFEDCDLLTHCEKNEIELALKEFCVRHPDAARNCALQGLLRGVAAHHAGCLPLWKSFIEVLFQRGLVKIVFATETLAAGMNMPARTAVIASLSRRNVNGHTKLSPNQLLQMAGRAGRRGIDERGHVVVLRTPYDGAEQYCKLLFAGVEPLVSQFTASYGMVLNLLAGAKVTCSLNESGDLKVYKAGRTLEEARKLVERSFGNYVGTNVILASKMELIEIQRKIELLTAGISDNAVYVKSRKILSEKAYKEIADLHEKLQNEKGLRTEMRRAMESIRVSTLKSFLKGLEPGHLPFICLQYTNSEGIENMVPALYLGNIDSVHCSRLKQMVDTDNSFAVNVSRTEVDGGDTISNEDSETSFYVALGSNNSWYLFTEKWINKIYLTSLPNFSLDEGYSLPLKIMKSLPEMENMLWEKLADSEFGGLWSMEGSLETWSWSLNVPVLSSLSEEDEVLPMSQEYLASVECYKEQRKKVARLKKQISRTAGFKEYNKIIDMIENTKEKISHLKVRYNRLTRRVEQIEPSGWKDFLQISSVIHESGALDIDTQMLFPLGETAAAIRGENELWLAMVVRNNILVDMRPAQLAAVCGSLVSDGIKLRPSKKKSYIYEPSVVVSGIISVLEESRRCLLEIQEKHGVIIPCCLDTQFCGMVEAWASGLSWREIMADCAMDEGDLARLLRRTTDLLAQIPKLHDIDRRLQSSALSAWNVMERSPISEVYN